MVDNANTTDFSSNNSYTLATISATLTQRYLIDETLHVYLVLSEQVQVADELSSEGDYGDYPAYSLSYTNSYDGSNTDADLPLTFSHWLATSTDAGSAANKQVMVYSNELNSSTVNRNGTGVQPALQLQDGATLAIRDLFGNALPINDDNTSISVYQEAEDNNINGVQLRGYLVPLDSVSLYQLTSANQTNAVDPDLTYIIGDQLVLDLTFGAELTETSYDPSQDLFLTLMFNDASSKEHILGDSDPSAGAGEDAGDLDQRYWYNSDSGDYDDNSDRTTYEANINAPSSNYNNVLRYIFTISDRADGDDFNTLEEGVSDPNLSITGLSFSDGLVDEYGSRVDSAGVLSALSAISIPITIDSIRPQIYLNSTASDGGDYIELADFTTYSRDDYFANLHSNVAQYPSTISFTLSFTEPIVMPARSSLIESGESDFSSGLRFQVLELGGLTVGERNASSAYVPYSGTGTAPEYTTVIFTYVVQDSDDSGISAVDINATIYDLAGNPNYYSSADSNDTHSNSGFAGSLYSGIELDGDGPSAAINAVSDVFLKVVQPGGDPSIPLDQSAAPGPYGVGTTLYFEIAYDQSIHTSNLASAAEDISLWLQPVTSGSAVAARIIDSQLNSYDSSSSGSIANRRLTFTYALSDLDVSDSAGYRLQSLDYSDESARYGILDSYGNGINDGGISHDLSALDITTDVIDIDMPEISAVSIESTSTNNNLYGAGAPLSFALTFSEAVALIESDFYAADNGLRFKIEPTIGDASYRVAAYSGSQTAETTFTFTYVVGSTEGEIDKGDVYLDDMTLLGNTYDTALNLETNLSYSGPSTGSANSGHEVDSGAPIVTTLSVEYQPSGGSFDAIQEGTAYTLGIGTTLRFSLTFDEAISFDTSGVSAVPYLELKAVDSATSLPQRIHADLNTSINSGSSTTSVAFTFVIGSSNLGTGADNNATQQSLYNTLELFSIQNGNQIRDLAGNVLSSSVDYALTNDPFETIHLDGDDPEPDALGDTTIYIDSVRPQITLLALDKSSAETYGFGEDIALSISFSEALNENDLDSSANVSRVVMHLQRTEPAFTDDDRLNFAYTFSKQTTSTDALGTEVAYILTSASQGIVYDSSASGSSNVGNFVNFVYEGKITGEYNLSGNIRDLGGNEIDPADLNIYTNGSVSNPTSLSAVSPTATVDHLAPRPLATTVRLSGGGVPEIDSTSSPYKLGDVFVFTITFHEELALVYHDDDLANLQLDLDFDANSTDRSIPLGGIPSGDPTKLYFTYTVSDGDQALTNGHSLALHGLSPATGYNTLAIVDAYGNSVDPSSIDFSYYDLDGNGSVDDAGTANVVDSGDENFTILQPDYNLSIDGIRPYWVSISSSYPTPNPSNNQYVLGQNEDITFTLTASEELSATESGMQLLLDLQPEDAAAGVAETRAILGDFNESHIITFVYTVGVSDPADNLGNGIDHLAFMASSAYQYGTIVTQDLAGNQVLENDFSLIAGFEVTPADETLSYNQVKFDTTPPIIESVSIDGFDSNNLAIDNTLVSFTLHFQDDDLDTVSIDSNRSNIELSLLNLATDYNRTSETNATLPLDKINADSLVFSGPLDENISWGGTFSLQIIDGNSTIVDKAEPANAMTSELVVGSGSDDLAQTYYIDTAPPRIANLNEIDSTLYTPITAAVGGYGPGRQATFLVTFNEELSSISGNGSSTAQLRFFIYDEDASAGTSAIALRARAALASGGNSDLTYIEDADGNKRSVARFYYTVSDDLNDSLSNSANYDGGPIYLNYSDVTSDPTSNGGDNSYYKCFDGVQSGNVGEPTDCYVALSAQLKDINLNIATYDFSDTQVYAFNRTGDATIEPMELTRFVTDPLEYIGYKIRVTPTGADRAWGFDVNSTDKNASASSGTPVIALNPDKPYIGASETEDGAGNPGNIYFIIEPGPEDFRLDTTAPVDVNLTFSIASAPNEDYIATYLDSNNEYITFEFNLGGFGAVEYDSNITLHSISQNASMEYSDASGVYVLADSHFYPSLDLDQTDSNPDQQFDTGLRLDMVKPELLSVIAYQEPVLGDSNFSIPVTTNSYLGRDAQVVLRFSFSENLGSVQTTAGNSKITLPLDLDTGAIVIEQGTPQDDNRSDPNDDFSTFDITYSVGDIHAGSINNDHFALDAIVSDQNGNTITGAELNYSLLTNTFTSPQVNGDYPEFFDVNIYRRINLQSVSSEVYDPIPDLAADITDYTLIGDDDFYIAATFTYTLDALQDVYPDFQEYDHDGDSLTDATIESNYSFSSQVSGSSLANAQYLATFSDANTSDGANVLLFSYGIALANDPADSQGNYLLLDSLTGLNDASKIRDIYGNPTSSYIPDFAADTVTRIDSTAPSLIGATHVVAAGQDAGKVNYGPLDSNITFALTFDEVIDSTESFKNLQLTFYMGANNSYTDRTIRQGTSTAVIEEGVPDPASGYAQGQIVNMIYLLDSTDGGTIDVAAAGKPMAVSGDVYDYHNGEEGNKASISMDINNSSDINSNFYIPVLTIDQTSILPARWSVEATSTSGNQVFTPYGSNHPAGLVWESNASGSGSNSNIGDARVGIGNTLSFIIDYATEIRADSLYADSDTTGSSPDSVLSSANNVRLAFTDGSGSATYYAAIDEVYNDPDPNVNSSSLIFTYKIEAALGLDLEDLAFVNVEIPPDTTIRSSAFNEIIISGADFAQATSAAIDATYPQITTIDASGLSNQTFSDQPSNRRYFGENDDITFRVTFSEELIDENTSDNTPDFAISWTMLDDEDNTTMRYFDSSGTGIATSDVSHSSGQTIYDLIFPVELESNGALTLGDYQGLIQFSVNSPTIVFADSLGVIQDKAYNSQQSLTYVVAADRNASNSNNYAVDFIRPRLQYIESHSSAVTDSSYTEYESVGGAALTHYYGQLDLSFYVVHDSELSINTTNVGAQPELSLRIPSTAAGDVELNLSLLGNNTSAWPSSGSLTENALGYELEIADAQSALSSGSFDGIVSFAKILNATNYSDKPGNYAYFQLVENGSIQYVYGGDDLTLDGYSSAFYSPTLDTSEDHAYPMPSIYIDTTAPAFSIANQQKIELTNRALIFELTLDDPLSDLELSQAFNTDSNSSYHSAPTYELSWSKSSGGTERYEGMLYDGSGGRDLGNNQVAPFTFTLFTDDGTDTLTADTKPDASADYATYLDDLQDSFTHTFTMEVTDFVGNSHSVTFDVEKGTDEFLGYLTGWDDSGSGAEYDTVSQDGQIKLADNATSATFAVSFITAIDETTLDAADFAFEYSTGGDDDISGLSIASIASNGSTTAANDYLITASGGNLPLAAGQLTLAFADSPSIEILGGGTYFDLNLISYENQSFAYSKDFNFSIDSVAQLNPSAVGEVPELEINFVAPDTGGSSSLTIVGYKLYYDLAASTDPDINSAYFSSLEHSGFSSGTNGAQTFANNCLPIFADPVLGVSSQEYSFRVVAQYSLDGNSSSIYETHINRGSTEAIELNATMPSYVAGTTLALPYCSRATIDADAANIAANFGRGLALSRDVSGDPLRNLLASGQYQSSNSNDGGAIRHYVRTGAEFAASSGSTSGLELATSEAVEFGHNLAFPSATFSGYDLFIAGDPFFTDSSTNNSGYVQLFHKSSSANDWLASDSISSSNADTASGAAVAIAVNGNGSNAFALYGEPRHDGDSGRVVVMKFNSSGNWSQVATANTSNTSSAGISGDSLFGSAIAVSADGDIVAIMSAEGVHIFSLSSNNGTLTYLHSIAAIDVLGVGNSFVGANASVNYGQALAIQKTALNDTYLLAIGLPHDSHSVGGIIYGSGTNGVNTATAGNYGGVLLLTTTTTGGALNANSEWRQLAYLRAASPIENGFYGSNLLFANPEQPVLFVSEPKLGYSYDTGTNDITSTVNSEASKTAKLHIYYLNTDGTGADSADDLIFSPTSIFAANTAGYAYAFDYAANSLALSSPLDSAGAGEVSLFNLFTSLDLSSPSGSAPKVLSSHAADPSNNSATSLTFGIRFPATVDSTTIDVSDFTPVITSMGGTDLTTTDLTINGLSGALDYWEVILTVTDSNKTSGEVHLAFDSSAEINSSNGTAFDLSEFDTTNITSSANASSYTLDYDAPALASIKRLNPSEFQTSAATVTFQLSFTNELNTSTGAPNGGLSAGALDDTLQAYFLVEASPDGTSTYTFDVTDLSQTGDDGIDVSDVSSSSAAGSNTVLAVEIDNIKDVIYNYQDGGTSVFAADSVANFSLSLVIATGLVDVLGDFSGNPLDGGSFVSANPKDDSYSLDYKAPELDSLDSNLPGGFISGDTTIIYTFSFSETVAQLTAEDFQLDIDEAQNSLYKGSITFNSADQLHEIFGGSATATDSSLTNGSGYSITPTSNSSTFTLTIDIKEADFTDLISEEFNLVVLSSVTDVYGNALSPQQEDDSKYTINFNQFVLGAYGPTIHDNTTGDLADGNYTSHLNIFSFLDQAKTLVTTGPSKMPSFGFSFNFGSEINTSSVSHSDFDIKLGNIDLNLNPDVTISTQLRALMAMAGLASASEPYALGKPTISFESGNQRIVLEYNLTDNMLSYGFDLGDKLSIAIKANNSIESTNGGVLTEGSQPVAYSIKSALPLLTAFERVDTSNSVSAADAVTGDYHQFDHDAVNGSSTYYGFQLRYSFSEEIHSARGKSKDGVAYSDPANAYYLTYGGVSLLDYSTANLLISGSAAIPNKTGSNYSYFTDQGALVKSSSSSSASSSSWDHLVYLTETETDFLEQNSEHNYTLVYDDDYITGYTAAGLPILFGGYGSSSYDSGTNTEGTFLLDEHGNPARIDPSWITTGDVAEGNATLALTFDTKTPVLTGVTALDIAATDTDSNGIVDDYNGSFGAESDVGTFAFELTFDKEISLTDLTSALLWEVDDGTGTGIAYLEETNTSGPTADTSNGFVYTTAAEVSGLYNSSGTYQIRFVSGSKISDSAGNQVNITAANNTLVNPGACNSTICSFVQTPVVLSGFSVDPATVLVLEDDTTDLAEFNVTLTFSEPVLAVYEHGTKDADDFFDLTYQDDTGTTILSTGGSSQTTDTIKTLEAITTPTTVNINGVNYYTEYKVSINDTRGFWARDTYLMDLGKVNSVASLFFESAESGTSTGTNAIIFTEDFVTATGAQVTLPPAIQSGTAAADGNSTIQYSLLANFDIPDVVSAEPVGGDGSSNYQHDAINKRHVRFEFQDADIDNGLGMLMLFRTTDNNFTNSDSSTAPYYGADGGVFITAVDGDYGYHICPPFNKHIERASNGIQHIEAPTYNEQRAQIHYLAIPYAASVDDYLVEESEISTYQPFTVDFKADDILRSTEPCVRSVFYNDGDGQYGYVVDSDQEEQHMVIANAMLQDANGSQANLAMLPTEELEHVYFDFYSKDYYNDSWRNDLTITANDLLDDLKQYLDDTNNYHDIDTALTFTIDPDYLSIFASRFVNTINARFLDSVFLDDLTKEDTPAHNIDFRDKMDELVNSPPYSEATISTANKDRFHLFSQEDYFTPNYRNQTPDALVDANDNRIVLSIGVHPSAISVDPGDGIAFYPFETDEDNFLKMNPEFYDLYYGGSTASNIEPAFDYTSRHLAYINFDLVYDLTIDPDTEEITGYSLARIVSPFSLLKHSFFESNNLADLRDNGQSYTAVAASIADNVFRHNFYGTSGSDLVQHFLPVGLYCYDPNGNGGICKNNHAQMLLPNPTDAANGYERTVISPHYLHRTVLHFNASGNSSPLVSYTIDLSGDDGFANQNPGLLLEDFMRLHDSSGYSSSYGSKLKGDEALPGAIGDYAYNSMLYNSFDRDHAYDYTYDANSENFAATIGMDGVYITDDNTQYKGFEQEYWGLSPYAESPDARADQILPNAFMLGGQMITPYHHHFLVKPYQFSGFTQQINSHLGNPDYLINKNVIVRGLLNSMNYDSYTDLPYTGVGSLNLYPNFAFPNSQDVDYNSGNFINYVSSVNYRHAFRYRRGVTDIYNFSIAHILSTSASYYQSLNNYYNPYLENSSNTGNDYSANLSFENPLYFSGRTPGFYNTTANEDNPIYGLMEYTSFINLTGSDRAGSGFTYRNDKGAMYDGYSQRGPATFVSVSTSYDGKHYAATINDSYAYDDSGKQRMFLPHHADDYDFDRGQIMAHKLGFFVDDGAILDTYLNGTDEHYGHIYRRLFFPSDPALITDETETVDYVVTNFDNKGFGEVSSYYPLVLAEESLHTADSSWPVLLTRHDYARYIMLSFKYRGQYPEWETGLRHNTSETTNMTQFDSVSSNHASFPVALNKIFPRGYRYQLGFVNREELFMYDATVGNGDNDTDPAISRFYSSAVGHFGYATQYSRLNRRAMQGYHNATSSQFLGDHLARFEDEPSLGEGVHTPGDIDAVFAHTPANQGGTGTNYGSYGAGHYNLDTTEDQLLSGTWRHRTYDGSLRGYVLELRTNPIYTNQRADYGTSNNFPVDTTSMQDLAGTGHPDGNPSP